MLTKTHR
jgi:predicted nuclease of restriction endonuclease-like (RecB) superfamily